MSKGKIIHFDKHLEGKTLVLLLCNECGQKNGLPSFPLKSQLQPLIYPAVFASEIHTVICEHVDAALATLNTKPDPLALSERLDKEET